jgi:hypothetical protein
MGVINTSLVRLYAPYSARMKFVDDAAAKKRKLPTALPPSSLPFVERKQTALHEAAHAVAARAYGLSIDFAEVGVSPNGVIGRVVHAKGAKGAAWARTVISLAGPSADLVFYNTSDNGARSDLKYARQYAKRVDPQTSGEVICQAWAAAEKIIRDNRAVISCLAAVLEYKGKLSGAAIDGIIGSISFTGKVRPGPVRPRGGGYQIRSVPCP